MRDLLKTDEEEWVEVSDSEGHTAALRHLATVRDGEKTYHVLGAFAPQEDGEGESGFLLIREDATADGAQQYVVASDEGEVERVIGSFVLHAVALFAASQDEEDEDEFEWEDEPLEAPLCPCGKAHAPGEFCVCGQSELLQ